MQIFIHTAPYSFIQQILLEPLLRQAQKTAINKMGTHATSYYTQMEKSGGLWKLERWHTLQVWDARSERSHQVGKRDRL